MWPLLLSCFVAAGSASVDFAHEAKPIAKVVTLLESMSEKLAEDQKADEEMKEKLDCWCKQNSKEKLEAAQSAKEKVDELSGLVAQLGPKIVELGTQIRSSKQELEKNKATLKTAKAIREEQVKAFTEDASALSESIDSVSKAKLALNASSSKEMQSAYSLVDVQMQRLAEKLQKVLEGRGAVAYSQLARGEKAILNDFIQRPEKSRSFLQKSEPTSSSIVGILQAMEDDFTEDLQKEKDEEQTNQKSFEALRAAKLVEVKALEDQITAKTQEKAESESTLEVSKEEIKATSRSRAADLEFQAAVETHCTGSDQKFQERTKTRSTEMQAVSKALEVFGADESREVLRGVSFLQISDSKMRAAEFLVGQGRKLGAESLVTLGLRGHLDSFSKVKEQIAEMEGVLRKQKTDEATHHEMCVDDLKENAMSTDEKGTAQNRSEDKIQMLQAKIGKCQKDVMSLREEVAEMEKQIQIAGQTRKKENQKFRTEATEQQQTQEILKKAVDFLRSFYSTGVASEKVALVQIQSHHRATPMDLGHPEGFKDYEKNGGGQGAISLIETIMEDAKKLETEAIKDEQDSQAAYEDFLAQTSKGIRAKQFEVDGKMKEMAEANNDKAEAESSRESNQQQLDQLLEAKVALHQECDFFMKNFEVRQKALADEIQALGQARNILSGQ